MMEVISIGRVAGAEAPSLSPFTGLTHVLAAVCWGLPRKVLPLSGAQPVIKASPFPPAWIHDCPQGCHRIKHGYPWHPAAALCSPSQLCPGETLDRLPAQQLVMILSFGVPGQKALTPNFLRKKLRCQGMSEQRWKPTLAAPRAHVFCVDLLHDLPTQRKGRPRLGGADGSLSAILSQQLCRAGWGGPHPV